MIVSSSKFLQGSKPKLVAPASSSSPTTASSKQPGFLSRVGSDLSKRASNVKEAFADSKNDQGVASGFFRPLETGIRTVGQAAGAIGDVIGQAATSGFRALPDYIENPIRQAGRDVMQTGVGQAIGQTAQKYESWAQKNPRAAKDLEGIVNITSLLPTWKGAQVAGRTALNTTVGAVEKVGSGLEKTGNVVESTAKILSDNAFTPNIKEAELLQGFKASVPLSKRVESFFTGKELPDKPRTTGATALEKGIAGTEGSMGIQAARKAQTLWTDTIQPAVKSIKTKLTKDEIFSDIQKGIDKIKDATTKKSFQDGFDSVKQDYKKFKDFTYEEAQAIKSELDRKIPAKMFRGKDVTGSANNIRKLMADSIRNRTYQVLDDVNIKKDYLDYGNLKNIMEHGAKATTKGQFKGGAGTFISGMYEMAVTPIKTIGSQVLYKSANGLRFVGGKGFKNFGQYLESFVK